MGKFCLYSDSSAEAPCAVIQMNKYSYLDHFINDKKHIKGIQRHSIPILIQCLKLEQNSESRFSAIEERCINFMFCVFGCIGNKILLNRKIHPEKFCYDISQEELDSLHSVAITLFQGDFIKLPRVPLSQFKVKFKSFEDFTSVDETKNIAVWTANAMKYLSSSLEPRVALEVGLQIEQRDRGGRLDVSLLNLKDNFLFVAETKVDFNHMMAEGRYESQMVAYETELEQIPKSIRRAKFLVIGGRECDLLPPTLNGSTSGPRGKLFYKVLREHNLFFFSANSLLALGLMKLYVSIKDYSLEALYPIMVSKQFLGILSSGIITRDEKLMSFNDAFSMLKD